MQHFFGLVKSSAAKSTSTSTKTVKKTKAPLSTVNSKPPTIQEETSDNNKDISSPSTDDAQSAAMDATTTNVLNSTFTKDDNTENVPPSSTSDGNTALTVPANPCTPTHNGHYHLIPGSSLATTLVSKTAGAGTTAGGGGGDGDGCPMQSQGAVGGLPQSYAMTPAESDPLFAYDNYDIGNLSSDDSTDDEDCPKKVHIHSTIYMCLCAVYMYMYTVSCTPKYTLYMYMFFMMCICTCSLIQCMCMDIPEVRVHYFRTIL